MPPKPVFTSKQHEPFAQSDAINLKPNGTDGTFKRLNPTQARYTFPTADSSIAPGVEFKWSSRDNRKGRHTIVVDKNKTDSNVVLPSSTSSLTQTLHIFRLMFTYFPIWDVSYLVAQAFTWGSVIFVLSGLFYWLPIAYPSTTFPGEADQVGGYLTFFGTIFYEVGVILGMFEAVNKNRTGCFGWALEKALSGDDEENAQVNVVPAQDQCVHHHPNRGNLVGKPPASARSSELAQKSSGNGKGVNAKSGQSWIWFPSWTELKDHYFKDMGFLSAFILFLAATIFWIIGFVSLPSISGTLSLGEQYGLIWTPDIVGSVGFVASSYILLLETQPNWYTPAPHVLGWHASLWNTIGSVGFLLSGCFGVCAHNSDTCDYQSELSTTWGSAAFLIGSVILWYEALDKYPVERSRGKSA